MLFSLYPLITQHYFILCFVITLGVLQWSAARQQKLSLSILGSAGFGWTGQIMGGGLVLGGFAWFFIYTPGLFRPGLAGGELSTLFGGASLAALAITRLAGWGWQRRGIKPLPHPSPPRHQGRGSHLP